MSHPSLRLRIVKLIALPLLAGLAMVGAASYYSAKHEAEEIYDAQLAHFARVLGMLGQHEVQEGDISEKIIYTTNQTTDAPYEKDFAYRVWLGDEVLMQSENTLLFGPPTQGHGFTDRRIDKALWRLFVLREGEVTVEVAENYHARLDLVEQVATSIMLPFLLELPLVLLAVWVGMRFGIRPLEQLSHCIGAQKADALRPIDMPDAPKEVLPIIASFNQLITQVEQLLAREQRFTGYAAHELRTPLATLKTQVQVALRSKSPEEQQELFADMPESIDRMSHLVDQLLALVRAQKTEQELEPLSLDSLVETAITDALPAMEYRHITHSFSRCETPCSIDGNREMLAILLRNLIDNAIRYSPENSEIKIQTLHDKTDYQLTISNPTTHQLSSENIQRIFEPFYRMKEIDTHGTGLGLAIVDWITRQHHAQICCSYENGIFFLQMRIPILNTT